MTIEPLTQDSCAFYDDVGLYADYRGVVLDSEECAWIGRAPGPHKAVILRNHGMLTVGASVDSAAWWFLTLERTCQSELMAYSAAAGLGSAPIRIDPLEAEATRGQGRVRARQVVPVPADVGADPPGQSDICD